MACMVESPMAMHMKPAASHTSSSSGDEDTQAELWYACAGPGKTLPPVNSVVAYFPQGHIEQIAPFNKLDVEGQIPHYNLPEVIRCTLDGIKLSADPLTDEVFATLTLLPEDSSDCVEPVTRPKRKVECFTKTLTVSDTSSHGGFAVPKRGAEDYLPPLDKSQDPPWQELVFKDLHGKEWKFKHIFRGEPKRHLFTTGWSTFVTQKRLVAGDVVLFLRGEDGQLRIGVRRAPRNQQVQSKVLTSPTMTIGVLAAAAHAAKEGIRFSLIYNPRSCPSDFVVPYSKYLDALKHGFTPGQQFKMKFESEDSPDRRFTGTITGISEYDPARWPNSPWRSLQVNWSESSSGERQNRVSPWEIEPFTACPLPPKVRTRKRHRPPCQTNAPDHSLDVDHGSLENSQSQTLSLARVLDQQSGRENRGLSSPLGDAAHIEAAILSRPWEIKRDDGLKTEVLIGDRSCGDWLHARRPDFTRGNETFRGPPDSRLADLWNMMGNENRQQEHSSFLVVKGQPSNDVDLQLSLSSLGTGEQQAAGVKSPKLPVFGGSRLPSQRTPFPDSFGTCWQPSMHSHSEVTGSSPIILSSPDCYPVNLTSVTQAESGSSSHTGSPKPNFWDHRDQSESPRNCVTASQLGEQKCKIFGVALDQVASAAGPVQPSDTKVKVLGTCDDVANQSSGECVQKPGASLNTGTVSASASMEGPEPESLGQKCKGAQNWQQGPVRSFTKVYMHGAIGRSIDVTKFDGYHELLQEVEQMFGLEGELVDKKSRWQLVYTDHEDDVLMVGDDPWLEFCSCVRSIRVVSRVVSDTSRSSKGEM